jgi:hypothetical protein
MMWSVATKEGLPPWDRTGSPHSYAMYALPGTTGDWGVKRQSSSPFIQKAARAYPLFG